MDKNFKKQSREITPKDKVLVNTRVFVANSRSSNLSSATSSPRSRPIQTKISKLTIYEPQPNSPAKFTVKSVHTRMNHDHQPEELVKKNINQTFKPKSINLKELNQDTAAEYEKKKLERHSDCQNIKSLLNEITQNNFESNQVLLTPPNNIKTDILQSHRTNPGEKPSFKSKQILSAIAAEEQQKKNNFTEDNLKSKVSENLSTALTKNLLQNEMESKKLETVLENIHQNKIINYGKQKQQFGLTNQIENTELPRSKTDLLITERSDFMQISPPKTVRSQSSINLNSDGISDRKKSYNPEEARRFMQEQKKKRRLNAIGTSENNANDKEAIKKRLEDLRKNSLKILQRSVKIAKKKDPTPQQQYLEMPSTSTTRNINGQMVMTKAVNQREEEKVLRPQNSKPPPVQHSSRVQKSNSLEIKNSKIGLLRKETDENSFSALNDKENLVSNTPRLNPTTEILQKITDTLNRKGSVENILPDNETEKIETHFEKNENEKEKLNVLNVDPQHPIEYSKMYDSLKTNPHNLLKPSNSEDIDLKVPDAKLNSKILHSEKSVQCDSEEKLLSKQNSLPYWLKPSPIQIYPYNFIMAVRKKLEAITNPTLATNETSDHYKHVRTENNPKNTPVSYLAKNKAQVRRCIVDSKIEENEKSRDSSNSRKSEISSSDGSKISQQKLKNNELLECVTSAPAVIKERTVPEKKSYKFSKSSTDTTSNFSSMSIHIPKMKKSSSNRMLSSTKIDGKNDDTTISSSVFSSPEKKTTENRKAKKEENKNLIEKPLSPLSVENISNLRIKSKYLPDGINADRGDNVAHCDIAHNIHIDPMNEVDFNKFLNDFNQSLSQVIEVNQQLKVTLDKSNQIFNRNQQIIKKKDLKTDEYTSDFEEETIETISNANNFPSTETNQSSIPVSTILKANSESLQKDQSTAKISQSGNHDRNKNLERHSTDSEILEIITSNTLSRTISVSLKSSKDFTQTSNGTMKNGNGSSLNTVKKDIESSNVSSSSGSDNHSIKIIHHKEIENYSMKSNDLVESLTNNLNQNKDLDNLNAQHCIDMIPEKLNKSQSNKVEENIQLKYDESYAKKKIINTSASSEFVAVFNQSDFDFPQHSGSNLSESTLNYSSIGLYEQLLQNENRKTEQLAAFLRMREKVILDRAKGQIAWLEVQREKIRSRKNLNSEETSQLIALKKRQRGILLKMEKEREEIQKLLQNQVEPQSSQTRPTKLRSRPKLSDKISDVTIRKSVTTNNISNTSRISTSIVRGFELQGDTQKLEEILKRREEELKKRREYAERLMEWHQRLDREEHEVLLIEKTLYNSNLNQISSESHQAATPNLSKVDVKRIKKLKEIDKSLRKIQNISTENENHKEISGLRLNKLWNRLTGRNDEKFIPDKEYDINKYDLERLYEEAKEIVSRDFNNDEFLQQFRLNRSGNTSSESQIFKVSQTGNENNNNEHLENSVSPQKEGKNEFADELADATDPHINQDKLNELSNESTLPQVSSEKSQDHSFETNEITGNKSDAGSTEHLSSSINNDVNIESQPTLTEFEPVLESNEVQFGENQPSIESLRPSVIVSLQKSQEDLCPTNETSNEILDEISIETKISKESTNASQMNSEDLGRINSALSITSESGIFNNSYENVNDNSNLDDENNTEPVFPSNKVNNSNKIETEPLEIISDMSGKSSMESIREASANSTDIPESISSKNNDPSSDVMRYEVEDGQIMFNNEDTEYENEIFESDTLIEDISSPKFESTLEESRIQVNEHCKSLAEEILESNKLSSNENEISNEDTTLSTEKKNQSELEKRLIDIDDSLKDLTDVFEHALSPDKSLSPPLVNSTGKLIKSPPLNDFNISSLKSNIPIRNFTTQTGEGSSISGAATQKMPDIISEVEVRRRQIFIESEMKQVEQTIPYYFNREIPNKPPPPYHSPVHGSPMTIIFPSENRIKEIAFKRTKELYDEITENGNIDEPSNIRNSTEHAKKSLIIDENITNIYERIVLDICQEYINECKKTLIDLNPETYKNSLALFNPPDKLKCLQEHIYKNVRKSLGMDKSTQQTHQPNLLKNNSLHLIGRNNKRDNVDDILIEELYEEESKWLNFDIEEEQVKNAIIDEILNDIIKDVVSEVVDESIKLKQEKF